jgi:hypothetical protein
MSARRTDDDAATSTDPASVGAPITGDQKGDDRRRRRRWPWIAGAAVAVIVAVAAEAVLRDRELGAVIDHVEDAEEGMADADRQFDAIADAATRNGSGWSDLERERFADAAEDAAVDLLVSVERLEDETVLPWHRAVDRARDRYLEHAEAWLDVYESWADDEDEPAEASVRINATWELAEDAFEDATVPLLGRGDADRIDRIFAG